jgi:hypothetical protein
VRLAPAVTPAERRAFYDVPRSVYQNLTCYRATEDALVRMLVDGPTAFHRHAEVAPHLMLDGTEVVGRYALVHDSRLPDVVQVAFFEAMPGLDEVCRVIQDAARAFRPGASRIVVVLNGHLNYGAGFLLSRFDRPPLFGLPYTPPYYADYFGALRVRGMVSFRFELGWFYEWFERRARRSPSDGFSVRPMDPSRLDSEIERYTAIDNASFTETPNWSPRDAVENYELFAPFRAFIRGDNLLFAEFEGQPVGFLLWYPDFNELAGPGGGLGAWQAVRFRLGTRFRCFRLTEVALLPGFRRTRALLALVLRLIPLLRARGFTHGEGGFILETNRSSLVTTAGLIRRVSGKTPEPYRRYGIFEGTL